MPKGKGGNGPGGGGGGGDPVQDLTIFGTAGDDRLRGGDGNDRFISSAGDDIYIGGGGVDTAVYQGSVWDYHWRETRKGWIVDDAYRADGDDGRDDLSSIEYLEFSDATINLNEDFETVIDVPDPIHVTYGDTADFSISVLDYDNQLDLDWVGKDLAVGRISLTADNTYGRMGDHIILNGTFDSVGFSTSLDLDYLALGETITVTYDFELVSYKTWEVGSQTTSIVQVQFIVAGVNEAPEFAAPPQLVQVVEDGQASTLDLTQFADDVDSDDDNTTLRYEIVSVSDGFDVQLDGGTLIYSPDNLDQRMTSDEVLTGEVVLRVVDRHGAASGEITVDLQANGSDDPTPVYVTPDGPDLAALGIDPASAPFLGQVVNGFGGAVDPALVAFSAGDDVKVLHAGRISGFQEGTRILDANGNVIADTSDFNSGDGDDVLAFKIAGGSSSLFEFNDITTGSGEDVVLIDVDGIEALINNVHVSTGIHSDQVHISLTTDNGWINGSVGTGSGHDTVVVELLDNDPGAIGGFGFVDAGYSLGSGDDSFYLTVAAGDRVLQAGMDLSLNAGSGDDHAVISNADTQLVILPDQPTGGQWDDLYFAGLDGWLQMGDGDDVLELALNDAYVSGASAQIDGGTGFDTLILHHLNAGDITVSETAWGDLRVQDGYQTLDINGFEVITLGDGTDLFGLV